MPELRGKLTNGQLLVRLAADETLQWVYGKDVYRENVTPGSALRPSLNPDVKGLRRDVQNNPALCIVRGKQCHRILHWKDVVRHQRAQGRQVKASEDTKARRHAELRLRFSRYDGYLPPDYKGDADAYRAWYNGADNDAVAKQLMCGFLAASAEDLKIAQRNAEQGIGLDGDGILVGTEDDVQAAVARREEAKRAREEQRARREAERARREAERARRAAERAEMEQQAREADPASGDEKDGLVEDEDDREVLQNKMSDTWNREEFDIPEGLLTTYLYQKAQEHFDEYKQARARGEEIAAQEESQNYKFLRDLAEFESLERIREKDVERREEERRQQERDDAELTQQLQEEEEKALAAAEEARAAADPEAGRAVPADPAYDPLYASDSDDDIVIHEFAAPAAPAEDPSVESDAETLPVAADARSAAASPATASDMYASESESVVSSTAASDMYASESESVVSSTAASDMYASDSESVGPSAASDMYASESDAYMSDAKSAHTGTDMYASESEAELTVEELGWASSSSAPAYASSSDVDDLVTLMKSM
jgi:hypothetical protein